MSLSWRCCPLNSNTLLVRQRGTQHWHFALGTLAEVVGMGWPAQELQDDQGKVAAFMPQKEAPEDPRELITYFRVSVAWPAEESEHEAMPFKAQSPLAQAFSGQTLSATTSQRDGSGPQLAASSASSQPAVSSSRLVRGRIVAVPISKLRAAERLCFKEWGVTLLKDLAEHIRWRSSRQIN